MLTERYAELCADAAEHHDAPIVYEFMPPDVNVHDLETALALVEGADAPNGGLAVDTWHLGKLRLTPDDVRRIPARHIGWVELSDGRAEDMEDLVDETINHRELPGEGDFPVREYVAALRDAGYDGPWGSRCSRRSCAACRSSRCSTARTGRAAPRSAENQLRRRSVAGSRRASRRSAPA